MFDLQCILNVAEEMSEQFQFNETSEKNYTYYSSKYSKVNDKSLKDGVPETVLNNADMYTTMYLEEDTHFYNISVNTTHSSVHVPSNVYDKS